MHRRRRAVSVKKQDWFCDGEHIAARAAQTQRRRTDQNDRGESLGPIHGRRLEKVASARKHLLGIE